jgi:hypothetical protein
VRLAIADPPYLGKSEMWYGARDMAALNVGGGINPAKKADVHPDAAEWDDPERHREMVERLCSEYDGWAIAMIPDNLFEYLTWVPRDVRIAVWHDPQVMPNGAHPRRRWEAVLLRRPAGRRRVVDVPLSVGDVLTCPHGKTDFAGRKPLAWTEWVLSMLGYCPTHDTVDDLFTGSGAVSVALSQGRLIECRCKPLSAVSEDAS